MKIDMAQLGSRCRDFRRSRRYYQSDVAEATGYTIKTISLFEAGKNDNYRILLWYMKHGMTLNEVIGYGEE